MPIRAFWVFNGSINKLRAEADLRQMNVIGSSQSTDAIRELAAELREELGQPVVSVDNRRQKNATQSLRDALS